MYLLSSFSIKVDYFNNEPLIFVGILQCYPSSNMAKLYLHVTVILH